MLDATTLNTIRKQVAWRLDCAPEGLDHAGVLVQPHGPHWASYWGIYVWLMHGTAVVSLPPEVLADVRAIVAGQVPQTLADPALWHAALSQRIERIVGPSYQGYVDAQAFRPAPPFATPPGVVRVLGPADRSMLDALTAACPPQEWEHSAIQPRDAPIYAAPSATASSWPRRARPTTGQGLPRLASSRIPFVAGRATGAPW